MGQPAPERRYRRHITPSDDTSNRVQILPALLVVSFPSDDAVRWSNSDALLGIASTAESQPSELSSDVPLQDRVVRD